jgi:hypothetical protein
MAARDPMVRGPAVSRYDSYYFWQVTIVIMPVLKFLRREGHFVSDSESLIEIKRYTTIYIL